MQKIRVFSTTRFLVPQRLARSGLLLFTLLVGMGLSGITSTATAQTTITVTTLSDRADSPLNGDGICPSSGTISNLPGADGLVSLREAIITANHTAGVKIITFASSLSGGAISVNFDDLDADTAPDQLPALCGNDTTINGDLDGDNVPDITVDGLAFTFVGNVISADGLLAFSSRNTINGMRVQNFPEGGIIVFSTQTNAPADRNVVSHNIVRNTSGGIIVQAGAVLAPLTPGIVTNTRVSDNTVSDNKNIGIEVFTNGIPGSSISSTTITHNQVSKNPTAGITVISNTDILPPGATTTITQTAITDNTVTQNGTGISIFPFRGDNYTITDSLITGNILSQNTLAIWIMGGFQASSNTVSAMIEKNTITENTNVGGVAGILIHGGFTSSFLNHLNVIVSNKNTLKNNNGHAIGIIGGQQNSSNNTDSVVEVSNNLIEDSALDGILAVGGLEFGTAQPTNTSSGNKVNLTVNKNTVSRSGRNGISLGGGGSTTGTPADKNQIIATVTSNTVEQSASVGISLIGGSIGIANNNLVTARVRKNTACNNTLDDIYAAGGFLGFGTLPPNAGIGNQATGDILDNIATNILVENGVLGNTASFSLSGNLPCDTPCATDVSAQVKVTRGGFRFDNLRRRYIQQITLTNTSGSVITGPFALVLDNLSPMAKLFNAGGTTTCATPESPFINVNTGDGILSIGERAFVILEFTNPSNRFITYTTRVLAGVRK